MERGGRDSNPASAAGRSAGGGGGHGVADGVVAALAVVEVGVAAERHTGVFMAHDGGERDRFDPAVDHAAGEGVAHGVEADVGEFGLGGGGFEAAAGGVAVGERFAVAGGED